MAQYLTDKNGRATQISGLTKFGDEDEIVLREEFEAALKDQNIKTFTHPNQLGIELVDGKYSIVEMCEAMPDGSNILYRSNDSENFLEFNDNFFTLRIVKQTSARCIIEINESRVNGSPKLWTAFYRPETGLSTIREIITDNPDRTWALKVTNAARADRLVSGAVANASAAKWQKVMTFYTSGGGSADCMFSVVNINETTTYPRVGIMSARAKSVSTNMSLVIVAGVNLNGDRFRLVKIRELNTNSAEFALYARSESAHMGYHFSPIGIGWGQPVWHEFPDSEGTTEAPTGMAWTSATNPTSFLLDLDKTGNLNNQSIIQHLSQEIETLKQEVQLLKEQQTTLEPNEENAT